MQEKGYEEKLKSYIHTEGIRAEHLVFTESCHSVAEAAHAVNADIEDFVKNLCLISDSGEFIVAIIKGEDKLNLKKIREGLNITKLRMATAEEVLINTGYPCGGTPSFGYRARFLIDPRVLERKSVYSGGGSEKSLVIISPQDLLPANKGSVLDMCKLQPLA